MKEWEMTIVVVCNVVGSGLCVWWLWRLLKKEYQVKLQAEKDKYEGWQKEQEKELRELKTNIENIVQRRVKEVTNRIQRPES